MCNFLDSVANGMVAGIIICSQQGHGFISPGGGTMVCLAGGALTGGSVGLSSPVVRWRRQAGLMRSCNIWDQNSVVCGHSPGTQQHTPADIFI